MDVCAVFNGWINTAAQSAGRLLPGPQLDDARVFVLLRSWVPPPNQGVQNHRIYFWAAHWVVNLTFAPRVEI